MSTETTRQDVRPRAPSRKSIATVCLSGTLPDRLDDDRAGIADVPADKLLFVQLADGPKLSMDVLSRSRNFRNFPGQRPGYSRVHARRARLRLCGAAVAGGVQRRVPCSARPPACPMARDGMRSLIRAEAEAGGGVALSAPPVLDGVGFLEFAVDEIAGQELARLQALPAGRMDSFVRFWRAVVGLQPQPQIETADPLGQVRSRALVSPNGTVRLALNASEGRGVATGRFIPACAGVGVHISRSPRGRSARPRRRPGPAAPG